MLNGIKAIHGLQDWDNYERPKGIVQLTVLQ